MIDPFLDLKNLTEAQLEQKIQDLTKKYFMAMSGDLRVQIIRMLDIHKEELYNRRMKTYEEQFKKQTDAGLDNLININ